MESQTRDSAFDERRVVIDPSPPAPRLHLECEISNVVIDPTKTVLTIIDMQNFSMHRALGRQVPASMEQVEATLVKLGLPTAKSQNTGGMV
jgi:isochorismate hydrolase